MNGFDQEQVDCGHSGFPKCPIKHPQYAYVPPDETKPYFDMAKQYVLGDRMFESNFDESSFVAHQYLIAAQSSSTVNYPDSNKWGCEGGDPDTIQTLTQERKINWGHRIPVCFDNTTLGDELDEARHFVAILHGRYPLRGRRIMECIFGNSAIFTKGRTGQRTSSAHRPCSSPTFKTATCRP